MFATALPGRHAVGVQLAHAIGNGALRPGGGRSACRENSPAKEPDPRGAPCQWQNVRKLRNDIGGLHFGFRFSKAFFPRQKGGFLIMSSPLFSHPDRGKKCIHFPHCFVPCAFSRLSGRGGTC
jgi:hypothetical protein